MGPDTIIKQTQNFKTMDIVICQKKPSIDYKTIKDAQAIDLAREIEKFYERNQEKEATISTSMWLGGDMTITAKKDGKIVEETEYCLR